MKANSIKALDYQAQGKQLVLTLSDTSLEQITGMDTALLRITTDDGDLVEAFSGYRVARVTYEAADGTFQAVLDQGTGDTTAAALAALTEALAAAEGQNKALQQTVNAQQTQLNEQADALIELAGLLAEGTEV